MPGANGDIWIDYDGQFIVTENGELIILVPEEATEPSGVWQQESGLQYDAWDKEE